MIRPIFLVLVLTASSSYALQCHVVSGGNLSLPDASGLTDCGLAGLSCVKIVDYSRGIYTKQCQNINCTMNNLPNSVANCQNSTTFGLVGTTCCCYGDGCNSAPKTGFVTAFGLTAAMVSLIKIVT